MKKIENINDIDLNKNAVIEASAGTGKTYTLENLVLRIIKEKNINLKNILIVTFTNKAALELKTRIRQQLKKTDDKKIQEENLIEESQIDTIHGFCLKTIKQYSFEISVPFNLQVDQNDRIYIKLLNDVRRKLACEPDKLKQMLKICDPIDEKKIVRLMKNIFKIDAIENEDIDSYSNIKDNINKTLAALPAFEEIEDDYKEFLGSLGISKNSTSLKNYLKKLKSIDIKNFDLSKINNKEFIDNKIFKEYPEKIQNPEIIKLRTNLIQLSKYKNQINNFLFVKIIKELKEKITQHKIEEGIIDYDDMILILKNALDKNYNKNAGLLIRNLREKYKYVLIDEFQDTDKLQWEIFQKVFAASKDNYIYLIGDPKQAIYAFRGADIFTYLKAKQYILSNTDSEEYSLYKNYRSSKELIERYNVFFKETGFFKTENNVLNKIKYQEIEYPDDSNTKIFYDKTGTKSFNFLQVDNNPEDKIANLREAASKKIVYQIKNLMLNNDKFQGNFKNERDYEETELADGVNFKKRNLRLSDICILIDNRNSIGYLEKYLKKENIPYTFYKMPGVFSSKESIELKCLLDSIDDFENKSKRYKALLTDFFKYKLEDLEKYEELPDTAFEKMIFMKWKNFADANDFYNLFYSILYDTKIYKKNLENNDIEGLRRLTNFEHIIEELLNTACLENFNLKDVIRYIKELIITSKEKTIEDYMKLETLEDKVVILTIHSAKGLEFPICFFYAGLSEKKNKDKISNIYHDENNKLIYTLNKKEYEKEIRNEDFAEILRLHYVALTRAIYKIFIPYFKNDVNKPCYFKHINDKIKYLLTNKKTKKFFHIIEDIYDKPKEIQTVNSTNLVPEITDIKLKQNIEENFTPLPDLENKAFTLQSYSSITKYTKHKMFLTEEDDLIDKIAEEYSYIDDENIKKSEVDELTSSANMGLVFHQIFEKIDFILFKQYKNFHDMFSNGILKDKKLDRIITAALIENLNYDSTSEDMKKDVKKISEIVYNTLNAKLIDKSEFCLKQLQNQDCLKEVKFYYKVNENTLNYGFIDLLFRNKGKYYILDWKSNRLDDYSQAGLKKSIKENFYNKQIEIYREAVLKFLKDRIDGFEVNQHFGGIFYLFIRGIKTDSDSKEGIYFLGK